MDGAFCTLKLELRVLLLTLDYQPLRSLLRNRKCSIHTWLLSLHISPIPSRLRKYIFFSRSLSPSSREALGAFAPHPVIFANSRDCLIRQAFLQKFLITTSLIANTRTASWSARIYGRRLRRLNALSAYGQCSYPAGTRGEKY